MTRRDERKAENREKLLAAARKVFAEKGLGAATARDIVRETDLASGTFYNYFTDKEDAFRAVLDEFTTTARIAAREQRLQPGLPVEERLYNAYRGYFDMVVSDPELFEFLRVNNDAVAVVGAESSFDVAVRELTEDMNVWVEEGQLPEGVRPWLAYVARSVAGGAFQIAAQLGNEPEPDPDRVARFCTDALLNGLHSFR
jgi:AcrR family transcriptional regulator